MGRELDGRFISPIAIEAQSGTQYSATNATTDIAETKVNIPAFPPKGLCYRVKMAGTKSGANAAMSVILQIGATAVMTIAADDGTAVDWVAEFVIMITSVKTQKVTGHFLADTADPGVDYSDGTVDLSAGAAMVPQIVSAHGSDVVYCEMCTVESWQL